MGRGGAGGLSLFGFLKNLLLTLIHPLCHVRFGVFRLAGYPFRCPLPRHRLGCPLWYRLIHRLGQSLLRHGLAWNLTQNLRGKPSLARNRLRHRLPRQSLLRHRLRHRLRRHRLRNRLRHRLRRHRLPRYRLPRYRLARYRLPRHGLIHRLRHGLRCPLWNRLLWN